ncbi:MAG: hypothetical protein K0R09_1507 [Clostridiales bacterium]|nr:hypothetical protein [Clostridiales bacterium]
MRIPELLMSRFLTVLKSVDKNIVLINFASLKLTPSSFAESKTAFSKTALLNSLSFKLVPKNSAYLKLQLKKLEDLKCAPLKLT